MANTTPELTKEERAAALAKAAKARTERAALKDDIKAGKVSVAEVLDMEGDVARRMKVKDLIGIAESRRVQGLGIRQREALLAALED